VPRVVALDVGDVKIGVAATDELGIAVSPLRTLRRTASVKADMREIESILADLRASEVVIGLPLSIDGGEGPQALKTRDFSQRLARRLRIPVILWDESLTSAEAEEELVRMDVSRARRREVIDQMAAVVILRGYMQSKREKS